MLQDGFPPRYDSDKDDIAAGAPGEAETSQPESTPTRLSMRLMLAVTRLAIRFPVTTLALAVGLAGICVLYTATHLGYKSSRLDLLNPNSDHNRLWIDYIHEFGDEDDAVIVVEGPGRDQVVPVLEELSAGMNREKRLFHAILHEVDLTKIRAKGLHMLPLADLQKLPASLERGLPIIAGEWWRLQTGTQVLGQVQMLQAAQAAAPGIDAKSSLSQLERLADGLLASLGPSPQYVSPLPDEMPPGLATLSELSTEYLVANEGRMGFILLKIAVGKDELARGTEAVSALRDLIADSKARHAQVKIGLTGLPIMENDEMHSSESSMFWGGLVSFIGVVIVVIAGFGGLRHAVLANLVLLIGTAWAFGYATLVIGHLNILSVTFTATLVGVGIDYGTYYVSRYMQSRRSGQSCDDALLSTTRIAGPAIITGAMTTVVAFFATGLTNFTGIAELGIIAGGGILLCALAQLFVLPPLVRIVDHSRLGQKFPKPVPVHAGIALLMKAPRLVIAVGVMATIAAGLGIKYRYDYNLMNMQARGLESVELAKRLMAECDQSPWYALSVADNREQLLERKEKLLKLPSVGKVWEIASLLTGDDEPRKSIITKINQNLATLPERPPLIAVDSIEDLGKSLAQAQDIASRTPDGATCARRLELLREALRRLPPAECYAKISQFQQQVAGDLLSRLHVLKSVSNPEPPKLTDLPASLVSRFVGQNGKHVLWVYGRGDLMDMDVLKQFVADVRSVDPRATGNPLQMYECSLEMVASYRNATLYSLIVIFGVLWFDFRNLRHVMLAAVPQFMGIIMTFGLMGYLNVPLNPANLMAVPMILGIGVDYSVYIVHEYLEQKGRYRMSSGTAVAVAVDSLTTLIGYGSLLIATHQGLQSLGRVLTIAVTFCTLMSIIVLPAFLTLITAKRPLVPWVGDAVESYDHGQPVDEHEDRFGGKFDEPLIPTRRAA